MIDVIVTIRHAKACKMCTSGARVFFKRHNLDWGAFVKNGISAKRLIATDDAMALKVVKEAQNGWE